MKKITAFILLLCMVFALMAGCKQDPAQTTGSTEPQQTVPTTPGVEVPALEDVAAALQSLYAGEEANTASDYTRNCEIEVEGVKYTLAWSADVAEDLVKIVPGENGTVTVDVNEAAAQETPYVLTAAITAPDGSVHNVSWEYVLPAGAVQTEDQIAIVDAAYALKEDEAMQTPVTLTGVLTSVHTPWSEQYSNISVVLTVEGREDKPILCYRLSGEGAKDLVVGDIITVTGTIKNYRGTIEFEQGCTLDKVVSGGGAVVVAPEDPAEIVAAAFALAEGESLPYEATLTGEIKSIDTAYSDQYKNITVTIEVNGKKIQCFRLKGDGASGLYEGDTITVCGFLKNYYGKIEFDAGCTLLSVVKGERAEPTNDPLGIIDVAYGLRDGKSLPYKCTLTGVISKVNTPWSEQYGNITVTIQVAGREDKPIMCFRLEGDGAEALAVGDTITVTGRIKNYMGTVEFDQGCYLNKVVKGEAPEQPETPVVPEDPKPAVKAPEVGVAYKYVVEQKGLGKTLYFTGKMSGYYLATSDKAAEGVDVYLEEANGGLRLYFLDGETKTYINIVPRSGSADKANVTLNTEPACVYTWDAERGTLVAKLAEASFYLGTYGTYNTFSVSNYSYIKDASVIGVTQFPAHFTTVETGEPETPVDPETPEEPENPDVTEKTLAEALEEASKLANNTYLDYVTTVEGYVVSIEKGSWDSQYNNITFELDVDGTVIKCFRLTDKALKELEIGDQLKIEGKLTAYNKAPQFDKTAASTVLAAPSLAERIAAAEKLANNEYLPYLTYVEGAVKEITEAYTEQYKNVTFTIDVDGTLIKCYRIKGEGMDTLAVGDKVSVLGKLTAFNKKAQFANTNTVVTVLEKAPVVEPETPENPEVTEKTLAEALEEASKLANGEYLDYTTTVEGYVVSIEKGSWNSQYNNITFELDVDGTVIKCFRLTDTALKELEIGDQLKIEGKLTAYNKAPQFDKTAASTVLAAPSLAERITAAGTLANNNYLPYKTYVEGIVLQISEAYTAQYKNITFTIHVDGVDVKCYRVQGEGMDTLAVGDKVSVLGKLTAYNKKAQFDKTATVTVLSKAVTSEKSLEEQLAEAAALKNNVHLTYVTTVEGKVSEINTAYSSNYKNITFTLDVDGVSVYCYRIAGEQFADLKVGDTVKVTGVLTAYNKKAQFDETAVGNIVK